MVMNNIGIVQNGNQYLLYLPTNHYIGHLVFPSDHQYLNDAKALEHITKTVAARWGVYEKKKSKKG